MDNLTVRPFITASYQRRRTSWGFHGGVRQRIWKTTDAGKPGKTRRDGLARRAAGTIGLDVFALEFQYLYAQMEVGASTGTGGEEPVVGGARNRAPVRVLHHHQCFAGRESSRLTNADAA